MKEHHEQSDREGEQMALDCENIFREQEKLRLLNQQLQTQVTASKTIQYKLGESSRTTVLPISLPLMSDPEANRGGQVTDHKNPLFSSL